MTQEPIRLTQFSKGGGCGCKIAPAVLQEILKTGTPGSFPSLLVGNESSDDAAVYQVSEELALISTTDFFLPIVDDPFTFGQVAAANAISDIYAMGGRPLMAIAMLGWPVEKLPPDLAREVLEGGRSICADAGIPLAGGHTIESQDPIFGLSVTGTVHPARIKKNNTALEGDLLFLTKPLGVGLLTTALKRGLLEKGHYAPLISQLTSLNKVGEALAQVEAVHAVTDVTGFGLLGHLMEMAEGSGLGAEIFYGALPRVEGLDHYLKQRTIPDATFRNWNAYNKEVGFEPGVNVMEAFNLLPDPQTNGGLLIAASDAGALQSVFTRAGLEGALIPIGRLVARGEKTIQVKP
jgi:selenide,water dikinase